MPKVFSFILLLLFLIPLSAQESVTVPDVTGLPVPQAAAALNRAGLRLGEETVVEWTASAGQAANTIREQTPAAGQPAARGDVVNLTVLRPYTALLTYDDNDFTLVNRSEEDINVHQLTFRAVDETAAFGGIRWEGDPTVSPRRCVQVWSVGGIAAAKDVPGCGGFGLIRWMTTLNSAEHFWTGATGFEIVQDGIVRGVCDTSNLIPGNPTDCTISIGTGVVPGDITEYLYFSYNPAYFVVMNRSTDRWMPTAQITIGEDITLGDRALFGEDVIGDVGLLAPGQCLLFSVPTPDPETLVPETCDIIAQRTLEADDVFWTSAFQTNRVYQAEARSCPPALPEQKTICLLPR
ncbi:MAG: hypothetical protein OHK0046_13110 [Anaerolineae bacterium]